MLAALQQGRLDDAAEILAMATAGGKVSSAVLHVTQRAGSEAMFYYGNGRTGDPKALQYQGVIDETSRNCVVSNGLITVNMGVEGRVLLGPAGTQATVNAPIRFAVERDGQAVFSEKHTIPVSIVAPARSAEFVKVLENVAIPYLGGEEITIWVGFDTRG